jgi:hypothetical protein
VLDLIDRTAAAAWIAQIERTAGGAVALAEPMPGAVYLNRLAVEPDPHRAHLSCPREPVIIRFMILFREKPFCRRVRNLPIRRR